MRNYNSDEAKIRANDGAIILDQASGEIYETSKAEIQYLKDLTPGTVSASKALVADTNGAVSAIKTAALHLGASGSEIQVGATAAELNELDLSAVGAVRKIKKIAIAAPSPASGAEQETGWTLPAKCKVLDVFLNVTAAEATGGTKTLMIGTVEGAGSEFGAAIDVSGTGFIRPGVTVTAGATETYFSANTRGSALSSFKVGTDAAGDFGVYIEKPDFAQAGREIAWTPGSADWVEFTADLYIEYEEIA